MLLRTLRPGDDAARALLDRSTVTAVHVEDTVREILAAVRARGDDAVREYTERFDQRAPHADGSYELPRDEWQRRASEVAPLAPLPWLPRQFHRAPETNPWPSSKPARAISPASCFPRPLL